jgi:multidrug efflux pump
LLVSQILTLYTTPVIYIFFDRIGQRFARSKRAISPDAEALPGSEQS